MADFISAITEGLAGLMSAVFQAFGTVTFVFAIVQWAQPNLKEKSKGWDPRQMKDSHPWDHVSIPGQMVEIMLTAIVVLLFNFFPHLVGLYSTVDGQWVGVPLLSPEFFRYMPWLNVLWGASILVNLLLINSGRWTRMTRWLSVGTAILTIVIMISMLFGPNLLALDSQAFIRLGWGDADLGTWPAFSTGWYALCWGSSLYPTSLNWHRPCGACSGKAKTCRSSAPGGKGSNSRTAGRGFGHVPVFFCVHFPEIEYR